MSQNPLKKTTDLERKFKKSVTSSPIGNMLMLVRDNQGALAAILGERCTSQAMTSDSQKALCALATHAFNLARSADIVITWGYPIQAFPLVRAAYEAISACLYFRSSPDKATEWLQGKSSAHPKYATVAASAFADIFDEYAALRNYSSVELEIVSYLKRDIPRIYGLLSKHTHPEFDAVRHQFYIDDTDRVRWMNLGPRLDMNDVGIRYALFALSVLFVLQVTLVSALLVEFREAHLSNWSELAKLWEKIFFPQANQFRTTISEIIQLFDQKA